MRRFLGYTAGLAAFIALVLLTNRLPAGPVVILARYFTEVTAAVLVGVLAMQHLFIFRLLRWPPAMAYSGLLFVVLAVSVGHLGWPALPLAPAEALAALVAVGNGQWWTSPRRLLVALPALTIAMVLLGLGGQPWSQLGNLVALALLYYAGYAALNREGYRRALVLPIAFVAAAAALAAVWPASPAADLMAAALRTVAYASLTLSAIHEILRAHRATAAAYLALGVDAGTLLDALDEVLFVKDTQGALLFSSNAVRRYGLDPLQIRGRTWADLADPSPPPLSPDQRLPVYGLRHADTGRLHWLEESARTAEVRGRHLVIGTLRDVSQRMSLSHQLMESTRLAAVGELSAGMAHNFNNLLAGIELRAEHMLLQVQRLGDDRLQTSLEAIVANTRRGAEITRKLMTFARGEQGRTEPLPLDRTVQEALEVVEPAALANVDVRVQVDEALTAMGDPAQVQQVLVNLILNAAQAMDRLGILTIRGRALGERVVLHVQDSGPGIPPELHKRIFEPFFSTRRQHGGTGLGLSVSLGMVRSMGGDLRVTSSPGAGATFTVILPAAPPTAGAAQP